MIIAINTGDAKYLTAFGAIKINVGTKLRHFYLVL